MCFSYGDEDGEILQWCQGTVMRILREERTFVIVQIKWDVKCLREGDNETTCKNLRKLSGFLTSTSKGRGGKTCIIWPKLRVISKLMCNIITK